MLGLRVMLKPQWRRMQHLKYGDRLGINFQVISRPWDSLHYCHLEICIQCCVILVVQYRESTIHPFAFSNLTFTFIDSISSCTHISAAAPLESLYFLNKLLKTSSTSKPGKPERDELNVKKKRKKRPLIRISIRFPGLILALLFPSSKSPHASLSTTCILP